MISISAEFALTVADVWSASLTVPLTTVTGDAPLHVGVAETTAVLPWPAQAASRLPSSARTAHALPRRLLLISLPFAASLVFRLLRCVLWVTSYQTCAKNGSGCGKS